jgi:hypothetical protein
MKKESIFQLLEFFAPQTMMIVIIFSLIAPILKIYGECAHFRKQLRFPGITQILQQMLFSRDHSSYQGMKRHCLLVFCGVFGSNATIHSETIQLRRKIQCLCSQNSCCKTGKQSTKSQMGQNWCRLIQNWHL